jgi:hypothetical protein
MGGPYNILACRLKSREHTLSLYWSIVFDTSWSLLTCGQGRPGRAAGNCLIPDRSFQMAGQAPQLQQPGRFLCLPDRPFCLPYHSPHKFRHGFAVLALKDAKDKQALKALSQTLMHSNLCISDGIEGIHSQMDRSKQIPEIGRKINS